MPETARRAPTEPGQWELVALAQRGDTAAFGELYRGYRGRVGDFLAARLADHGTVEDLVHETFARALHGIARLRPSSSDPGAWLVTIARHLLLDHLKSARHRREVVTGDFVPEQRTGDGPEERVLQRMAADRLWSRAADLSPDQRRCLMLRFACGFDVAETAARMGRDPAAVRALQYRAIRRLAALLAADEDRLVS